MVHQLAWSEVPPAGTFDFNARDNFLEQGATARGSSTRLRVGGPTRAADDMAGVAHVNVQVATLRFGREVAYPTVQRGVLNLEI